MNNQVDFKALFSEFSGKGKVTLIYVECAVRTDNLTLAFELKVNNNF